ncbi:putative TIR domain, P-loop containing nucleoside triphosphate hydrolase [Helianthus debilis subsp. tardiflorus]
MVHLTEIPSSSSSNNYQYDVFLSFRGVDTRLGFVSHLHKALKDANLATFLDDADIESGEPLKPELESAIKSSRASIIVLSKNYASSTWCLDELVLILEQNRDFNQIVIPIFYHVKPTHIRKLKRSFGDAMAKHKREMKAERNAEKKAQWAQKMELWKSALTKVVGLKGENVKGRLETEFLEDIVKEVHHRLGRPLKTTLPLLIGMENSTRFITSWLEDGSSQTADILTILGMGGIGKTTLAKHFYGLHCYNYTSSFIEDIGRKCAQSNGLLDVQKQLCDDISKTSSIQVHGVSGYTSNIENALAQKKVLLILDDIDSLDQLDALLGKRGFFSGSKVIITTRDASLVKSCALLKTKVKPKYTECTLKGLSEDASLELLCHHAFTCNRPNEDYEEVSKKLARYCEGHPLALEHLGKLLHNQSVGEWEDRIDKLKTETDSHVEKVLQMSFDSLSSLKDKNLFKHIACFFVGINRDFTETILKACDVYTSSGIKNLVDKCLLCIGRKNEFMMHRLIQDMGRDLVRQESPEKPWERSRIWCHEESFEVLKRKKGTENILGLTLDLRMLKKCNWSFELNTDALSKMDSLMLLQLDYVQMSGSYENFPKELRWLCMRGFPLKSIPLDLPMENLIVLDMSYSKIESFGTMYYDRPQKPRKRQKTSTGSCSKDKQLLGSLKILDLSFCEKLCSLGGFFELPALERLIVGNCKSLIRVCESIEHCVELVLIDLSNCKKLKNLPALGKLRKLETLLIDDCDLHKLPIKMRDVESREMLKVKSSDIDRRTSTSAIVMNIPKDLKSSVISLPSSLIKLSLVNNNLYNESFPMDFSCLSKLKYLYLDGNPIVSMPSCVRTLPRLNKLSMGNCKMLQTVEHPPCTIKVLSLESTYSYKPLLQKIVFDPKMSSLSLLAAGNLLASSSFEIEGMVKIQPLASVEETVLHSLGWADLEGIKEMILETSCHPRRGLETSKTQMYYEFGIFSTIYGGESMPNWIGHKTRERSISITIPSSPKKLRGLNFCYVQRFQNPRFEHPSVTSECGIGVVYDDGNTAEEEEEEEDPLSYYKSWNHIIGGDLYAFQVSGKREYNLHYMRFFYGYSNTLFGEFSLFTPDNFLYRERRVLFKAFSKRRVTYIVGGAPEDATE